MEESILWAWLSMLTVVVVVIAIAQTNVNDDLHATDVGLANNDIALLDLINRTVYLQQQVVSAMDDSPDFDVNYGGGNNAGVE